MNKKMLRCLGVLLFLDGVSLLAFGRGYVRLWQTEKAPSFYRRSLAWMAAQPDWALRAAGMAETGLGLAVMSRGRR